MVEEHALRVRCWAKGLELQQWGDSLFSLKVFTSDREKADNRKQPTVDLIADARCCCSPQAWVCAPLPYTGSVLTGTHGWNPRLSFVKAVQYFTPVFPILPSFPYLHSLKWIPSLALLNPLHTSIVTLIQLSHNCSYHTTFPNRYRWILPIIVA